jgi:hypothetical protein
MSAGARLRGSCIERFAIAVCLLAPQLFAIAAEPGLSEIIANNNKALHPGSRTASIRSMQIDLKMQDSGSSMNAVYRVTRDGRMRIDIMQKGVRVYTEAYDGHSGWDLGADGSAPSTDPHGDALWHGTQFPGNIFSLGDMKAAGHRLDSMGREDLDGIRYYVLKLTLSDGFETYRYVNPNTWLIDRGRDFRAFHPALNSQKTWVETRWSDYRSVGGSLYAFKSVNIDLNTGQELAVTDVTAIKVNPTIDSNLFVAPGKLAPER